MKEICRTSDIMKMHLLRGLLEQEGIESFVFDEHGGGLYLGMMDIQPRLMVIDDDYDDALRLLRESGLKF